MMKRVLIAGALAVLLCGMHAGAQTIYKSEKNGVTSYSTRSSPDANAVKLPELSVIPGATPAYQRQHSAASTGSTGSLPTLAVPASMIPGNNPNLLPPPPPSFGTNTNPAASSGTASREEIQAQLTKAREDLAAQDEIRLGDERNYQKKLDRLKPYQERVDQLTRALGVSP